MDEIKYNNALNKNERDYIKINKSGASKCFNSPFKGNLYFIFQTETCKNAIFLPYD